MAKSATHPFSAVKIVGTGLLGTSIGLALREQGIEVFLSDISRSAVDLAADYGAGVAGEPGRDAVDLVVVATPPDSTAGVVATQLSAHPQALVIDVASVKATVFAELRDLDADLSRYLGTHPMAGRERGGPTAARVDLFTGRTWVMCPSTENTPEQIDKVSSFARSLGATVLQMSASEHDQAVALVSHLPQVVSSVVAGSLTGAPARALDLAGQGLRDVTRIAGSDAALWQQILSHNAPFIAPLVRGVGQKLVALSEALEDLQQKGAKASVASILDSGVAGVSLIPGKHGTSERFATLTVVIDDTPGQLARLLTEVGALGVNLEDMRLDHSPGAAVGFVELSVLPDVVEELSGGLIGAGWRVAEEKR